MRKTKIAINGFGRIGRTVLREILSRDETNLEVVALNSPRPNKIYAHLFKYDSIHGTFSKDVKFSGDQLQIGNQSIRFFHEQHPEDIPWPDLDVDIVIDSSGVFRDNESLGKHLRGSVKKVILCAPGKNVHNTIVMGINHETYNPETDHIISNASCTTNCLAPVAHVLHKNLGIKNGFMTTIHSYTSDQRLLDHSHHDFRRARSAALSMIPTTTGAARSIGLVIPDLKGKFDGYAVRVPTPNVSMVDLTVNLNNPSTIEDVNNLMKKASESSLNGVLGYSDVPLVSIDYNGNRDSSIFDSTLTNMIDDTCLKIVSWYDNESGFSNRVIDLAKFIAKGLN